MEKEFVTYEQALTLKELGFDERCFANWFLAEDGELRAVTPIENEDEWYDENWTNLETSAPLKQQVFRWFREKYGLVGWIQGKRVYAYCIENPNTYDGRLDLSPFNTYEEAQNACIDRLILIAKQLEYGE